MEVRPFNVPSYGIRVRRSDRDKHFDRSWQTVILELDPGSSVVVPVSPSFWSSCPGKLRSAAIGHWLEQLGLASWPVGEPPGLDLVPAEGPAQFVLRQHVQPREFGFRIGEAFPADEPVARWLVVLCAALNDLTLAATFSVRDAAPPWEYFYFFRLTGAHFWETEKFIRQSRKRHREVAKFMDSLGPQAARDWSVVQSVAGDTEMGKRIEHLRNVFFHYPEMLDKAAAQYDKLGAALAGLSDARGTIIEGPALKDLRCVFADDIAARLTRGEDQLPADGDPDEVVEELVTSLRDGIIALQNLCFSCVQAYIATLPDGLVDRIEP